MGEQLGENAMFRALRSGPGARDPEEMSELWRRVVREGLRVVVPQAAVATAVATEVAAAAATGDAVTVAALLQRNVLVPHPEDERQFQLLGCEHRAVVEGQQLRLTLRLRRSTSQRARLRRLDTDPLHVISNRKRQQEQQKQQQQQAVDVVEGVAEEVDGVADEEEELEGFLEGEAAAAAGAEEEQQEEKGSEGEEEEGNGPLAYEETIRTLQIICKETWYDEGKQLVVRCKVAGSCISKAPTFMRVNEEAVAGHGQIC